MRNLDEIFEYFKTLFGEEPRTELNFSNAHELLIAVILSAQCTDKRVNIVTRDLFRKYQSLEDFANAPIRELERDIFSTGFYRNKAKNIQAMARKVLDDFDGQIPATLDELVTLPGVGRKTASVFIVEFHKIPAVPVDTHVTRVANRLGLSDSKNPVQIERDLRALLPESEWARWHIYLVLFGRYYCTARTKECSWCPESKAILVK